MNDDPISEHANGKRKTGRRLVLFVIVIASIAAIPFMQSERMSDVEQEQVDAAVTKWNESKPKSYDATINVKGAMPGEYRIKVRDGNVESVLFNDSPLTVERTRDIWTGAGMLKMVEMDQQKKDRLAEAGNETFVTRAYFDPQYGYPKRYLRLDYHTKSTVTWDVTEFSVR